LALDLDLKVSHGLADLVRNWERSDREMVNQIAVAHPEGVQVLAHAAETLAVPPLAPDMVRHLVVLLREMFENVVLDLGHSASRPAWEAIQFAEQVLVVVRPEVPALRLARAYLRDLRDRGLPLDRLRVVMNRTGHRQQVERKEAERVLGLTPIEWVPDEPATLIAALNQGQPLVQYHPRAKITRAFEHLAGVLAGAPR
jgi:pilus assembly protein CpaE